MSKLIAVDNLVVNSGTQLTHILSTAGDTYSEQIQIDGDSHDATVFPTGVSTAVQPGKYQWTATLGVRWKKIPITGYKGLVTNPEKPNSDQHVNAWTMTIDYEEFDVTEFDGVGVVAAEYLMGLATTTGGYDTWLDDTNAIDDPPVTASSVDVGSLADATFLLEEAGTPDNDITGSIQTTALGVSLITGQPATGAYGYAMSGVPTFGATAANILPDGALAVSDQGNVTFEIGNSRSLVGDCFLKSLTVTCNLQGLIDLQLVLRGTGVLTPD